MTSEDDKEATAQKTGAFDRLKDVSLKASGLGYLVGDASLFVSGRMAGRHKEANAGALYALGGLLCAKYGNPKADKQLQLLTKRLGNYLKKQGVEIPQNPDTAILLKDGGIIDHIETFFYAYPSQILNSMFAYGGVQLLRSGLQHQKHFDSIAGACVAAGGLAGLLITEKQPDPDHPPQDAWEKAVAWAHEKPLRVSGGLYMINNVALTLSALGEMRKNPAQKSYLFKFLTVASYLFANSMLSLSSKDNIGGEDDGKIAQTTQALADTSARVIAAQAPQLQEALVQQISGYLAAQPEINKKPDEIATLLHNKLAAIGKEPKAPETRWQEQIVLQSAAPPAPAL